MMDIRAELKDYPRNSPALHLVAKKLIIMSDSNSDFVIVEVAETGMSIRVRTSELLAAVRACSSHPLT